jgi:dTDP-4-dehydrorhamnose 3,5-epimerase-like enzyme
MQVSITTIDKIGEDERGATHFFSTSRTGQFIVAYRKEGSISGRHYHKGIAPKKNPEQIIIMQGKAVLNWKDVRTNETGSVNITAPAFVEIFPYVWHEVISITDIIVFELNGLEDAKEDTFRP